MENLQEILKCVHCSNGEWAKISISDFQLLERKEDIITYIHDTWGGNAVLHIGFAGHPIKLHNRIKSGNWFHGLLEDSFDLAIGVDINNEAVNICKYYNSTGHYFCYDAISEAEQIKNKIKEFGYDTNDICIILPDVLEHVIDPVGFLKGIKENYEGAMLLVTVPNAYSYNKLKRIVFKGIEPNNNDHKTIFSCWSFLKTFIMADISPIQFFYIGLTFIPKLFKKRELAGSLGIFAKL